MPHHLANTNPQKGSQAGTLLEPNTLSHVKSDYWKIKLLNLHVVPLILLHSFMVISQKEII